MKVLGIIMIPLLFLGACESSKEQAERAALKEQRVVTQDLAPATRFCIAYVTSGEIDQVALSEGGYPTEGKRALNGSPTYSGQDSFIFLRERTSKCIFNTIGVPLSTKVRTTLFDAFKSQGFRQIGIKGRKFIFSDGKNTVALSGSSTNTSGFIGTSITFSKG